MTKDQYMKRLKAENSQFKAESKNQTTKIQKLERLLREAGEGLEEAEELHLSLIMQHKELEARLESLMKKKSARNTKHL